MQKRDRNPCKAARLDAGLTQEQAAELLPSSVESVRAWENNYRLPDAETARRMADLYGAPWLLLWHAQAVTEPLGVLPAVEFQPLPEAVIGLLCALVKWTDHRSGQRLLQIAADGTVTADEAEDYAAICRELDAFAGAALCVRYARLGIKKRRSDGGTSDRRGDSTCSRAALSLTGDNSTIARPEQDCKSPILTKGGKT